MEQRNILLLTLLLSFAMSKLIIYSPEKLKTVVENGKQIL